MGAAVSLIAIAVGAVMDFAVTVQNDHGFNINRIGVILMIVGVVGLIISVIFWGSWGGFGSSYRRRTITRTSSPQNYDANGNPVNQPGTYVDETRQRF